MVDIVLSVVAGALAVSVAVLGVWNPKLLLRLPLSRNPKARAVVGSGSAIGKWLYPETGLTLSNQEIRDHRRMELAIRFVSLISLGIFVAFVVTFAATLN